MGAFAPWHWIVLIVVILLVFGGRLLPKLGKSLGKSVTGLKQGMKEGAEGFKSAVSEDSEDNKADADADADAKPKDGDGSK
jgi:sec-independent protein translocase protein TatA